MYVCIYISIYLYLYLSIYLSIYIYIYIYQLCMLLHENVKLQSLQKDIFFFKIYNQLYFDLFKIFL